MQNKTFNDIVEARLGKIRETLSRKQAEYADDSERFKNFKDVASMEGQTCEQALLGMANKHWAVVHDWIKTGKIPNQTEVDEKLGDWINYMILLEGIWAEKREMSLGVMEKMGQFNTQKGGINPSILQERQP